ncbi:MAG: hypothetical protein KDD50_13650 [Bdellovibrionales bacterium]|nr:hypothetical protein [Bdellovibrionales bacterium]
MKINHCLLTLLLLTPENLSLASWKELIIWNVGQGLWVTLVTEQACHHMDMGGEKNVIKDVLKVCKNKAHTLSLSHGDWDHLNFVKINKNKLPKLCLLHPPQSSSDKIKKIVSSSGLSLCVKANHRNSVKPFQAFYPFFATPNENAKSLLFYTKKWLNPGDSEKAQERLWADKIPLQYIEILILGHHGSKTSTSNYLLKHLKNLRIALSSSRKSKYGHPHETVQHRLKKKKVPLIRTEIWGHIKIRF